MEISLYVVDPEYMNQALLELSLSELQTRLAEAIDAYHRLMIGDREVTIRVNNRLTQYTPAQKADLEAYMAQLRGAILCKQDGANAAPLTHRPVYVRF